MAGFFIAHPARRRRRGGLRNDWGRPFSLSPLMAAASLEQTSYKYSFSKKKSLKWGRVIAPKYPSLE